MNINELFESKDACPVCGQTPCNCTHVAEEKVRLDPHCWDNKKIGNPKTKVKGGVRVNNCVPKEDIEEAQSMQNALINALGKVGSGSKLDRKIRHHNDMVRRTGTKVMDQAPDGYHFDKKGFIRLGHGIAEDDGQGNVVDKELSSIDPVNHDEPEGGFVKNQIHTMLRVLTHLEHSIGDEEDLPEWVEMKISQAQEMIVGVMNYMISDKEREIERHTGEDSLMRENWQSVNKHDKTDGMSSKAVKAYRRENPGSKLKTAVTTKPSKLKAGSKDAARRKSFCARMSGNPGPMKDEKGRPTPKAKALSRWNCE